MSSLRDRWHEFAAAEPGTRFELEYQRKRGLDQPAWKRVLGVLGGVALIVVGIVELAIPGPGVLVIGIGAALLGRESRGIARWLDRGEISVRRLAVRVARWWHGLGGWGRAALVVVMLAGAAGIGVVAVRLLLDW
ncbi:MAG: hypothetical protein JNM53_15365 [Gemmatimonadetes bacterium]|nr:hypothetical protein [Gemmatimonadota bacterium]